jgi:hypothetical protein
MKAAITSAFVSLLSLAAGHGAVTSYTITTDGKSVDYPGYEGFSPASSPSTIQVCTVVPPMHISASNKNHSDNGRTMIRFSK